MKRILASLITLALTFALIAPQLAKAQTPISIAVIGDSLSHEYHCGQNRGATAYNWVELLGSLRSVNFGALVNNCYAYDYAYSGYTIVNQMSTMVTNVINNKSAGNIGRVVILLGSNDISNGTSTTTMINTYGAQLDRLLAAGFAGSDILTVAIPQQDCAASAANANITGFNSQLETLATAKGVQHATYTAFCNALNAYNGGNVNTSTYNYGGTNIARYTWCQTTCLRIPDGHPGTAAQAIIANSQIAAFLGVTPLTEAEVLAKMGIGSAPPTNTPTATLTPTITPSPTATNTPLPTATPTPIILSCPVGMVWQAIDTRSVRCVSE